MAPARLNRFTQKFVRRNAVYAALYAGAVGADGVMTLYRGLNDPVAARMAFDCDFGATLEEPSPKGYGRNYLAYWEARNLRMAANIREAIGTHPGSRSPVIVGASHKWYLQAYLNGMHDVRIVDTAPLLR